MRLIFFFSFLLGGMMSFSKASWSQIPKYTFVDPFIGSGGLGHIFIGPSCPFGMVKPGPDCNKEANNGYGLNPRSPLFGFSQIHVSGTGGGPKYGNISIMPFTGILDTNYHESARLNEKARIGYYSVLLNRYGILSELTTSPKVAFYQFTYPHSGMKSMQIDCGMFLGEQSIPDSREAQQFVGSEIEIVSDCKIRGYSRIRGGWNNGAAYTVYFTACFDQPFGSFSTWKGKGIEKGKKIQFDSGEKTGALVSFLKGGQDTIRVKIGISYLSSLKADQNIEQEVPHWNFKALLHKTQYEWEKILNKIEIDSSTSAENKILFYTALYHTCLMPVDKSGENPLWDSSLPYYDDFYAIWDTFRSSNPLITFIAPQKEREMVNSLINIYKHEGYMPDARSGNCNGRTQGGSHGEVLIADAFVKGLSGINYSQGLEAMLKDAEVPPGGNEEKEGRGGLIDYNSLGYVSNSFPRSGNRTVDYAYDDFCISEVAGGLKNTILSKKYLASSGKWKNLWRPIEQFGSKGFIMPRYRNGKWVDSIICDIVKAGSSTLYYTPTTRDYPNCLCWWCGFLYEGSSWEYSLFVPQNIEGLIEISGGKNAFRSRLDTLFEKRLYNVANEPSFLSPNLYHWIGRPDLSSKRILEIIKHHYGISRTGLPGNDDSGAMSSWLAFHLLGLFPNAGQSYYLLNTPSFSKSILHLENGNTFTILTKNLSDKNSNILSAKLNGKDFPHSWIQHKQILEGGVLELVMTSEPSPWGKESPPSYSELNLKPIENDQNSK